MQIEARGANEIIALHSESRFPRTRCLGPTFASTDVANSIASIATRAGAKEHLPRIKSALRALNVFPLSLENTIARFCPRPHLCSHERQERGRKQKVRFSTSRTFLQRANYLFNCCRDLARSRSRMLYI